MDSGAVSRRDDRERKATMNKRDDTVHDRA